MQKPNWSLVVTLLVLAFIALEGCSRADTTALAGPQGGTGDSSSPRTLPAAAGARTPAVSHSSAPVAPPPRIVMEMAGKIAFPHTQRLYFETPGTVQSLVVDEGNSVHAGDRIAALDTTTVVSLQRQVAVAQVAVDNAEKALKDQKEQYIPGDVQALQARVVRLQKELYVQQQTLADAQESYRQKLEQKFGVSVPPALLNSPPDQLVDALVAQLGVNAFWSAYQDYARRLIEGPWQQINQLQGQVLDLQQTLRGQEQALDDLARGTTLADAQAAVQVANGKVETARLERAAAVLKQKAAVLQRDDAAARQDSVLAQYRDQVRDLLGLTVDRELNNTFYIHLSAGADSPRADLEQKLDEHVRAILGRSLQQESLKNADPVTLVSALMVTLEGRDHILDYFLREKASAPWLNIQKARQDVALYTRNRNQATSRFNGDAYNPPQPGAWTDIQVANSQLDTATQAYDTSRVVYKQLYRDLLNIDLDQYTLIIWDGEAPPALLKQLQSQQGPVPIPPRLRQELTQALQTAWSKVQQADTDAQQADLDVQKDGVAIQQADTLQRAAADALRQARNAVDDISSRATYSRLDAQRQATLSRIRQLQDQIKDARDQYKDSVDDYLGAGLSASELDQSPDVLLAKFQPADTPGFRRFKKDVVLMAETIWGQIQQTQEDSGKNQRTLKDTQDALADAKKGADPLLVAQREQELSAAQKNLEDLKRKLNGTVMAAPFDGVIRQVTLKQGDPVQAYQSVAEIIDFSSVEVDATVDELDLAKLAPGTAVQARVDAFPDRVFPGRLVSVNPVPNTLGAAMQYVAKISIDSVPNVSLYEGMSARVSMEAPQTAPAKAK